MRYLYYTAALETLSPVHIGSGEKLTKLDYVYSGKSRRIYVMHPMKLFRGLQQYHLLDAFEKGLPKDISMTDFLTQHSVPEQAYASWAAYSFPATESTERKARFEIQRFIKDAYGMPYIPGSSLKGALRTVLAADAILQDRDAFQNDTKDIGDRLEETNRFQKSLLSWESARIESKVFRTLHRDQKQWDAITNDCMAGLIVSDSSPASADCLSLSQKIDIFKKNENPLNILRETLKMKTQLTFDITIDTTLCPFSAKQILKAGDHFFSFYDDTFRSIFLDYLPPEINPENEMYLYLGGGTGFHHKTVLNALYQDPEQGAESTAKILDLQFWTPKHISFFRQNGYSPKAIKMTDSGGRLEEMGLCKLRFEEKKI